MSYKHGTYTLGTSFLQTCRDMQFHWQMPLVLQLYIVPRIGQRMVVISAYISLRRFARKHLSSWLGNRMTLCWPLRHSSLQQAERNIHTITAMHEDTYLQPHEQSPSSLDPHHHRRRHHRSSRPLQAGASLNKPLYAPGKWMWVEVFFALIYDVWKINHIRDLPMGSNKLYGRAHLPCCSVLVRKVTF